MAEQLTELKAGMRIPYGGDKVAVVPIELAESFREGDRLVVVQETGDLLHIPGKEWETAQSAVGAASWAFAAMGHVGDDQVTGFYHSFADRLADESVFGRIAEANRDDVASATKRGRSTTRLVLGDRMRADMIEGLRMWGKAATGRGEVVETVRHDGWILEQVRAGLGVVGFVFEGRPNVLADATGVLRAGNTAVLRIGSDALGTARAIVENALAPALEDAGLPRGAVSLVDTASRAGAWAMFSDSRLGLAVARGSGTAVAQLGAVARQNGIPVSLHGTGGAWIVAGVTTDTEVLGRVVYHSLDRKVCNTVNTVCIVSSRADELVPVVLEALDRAGNRRGVTSKLHVAEGAEHWIPSDWFGSATISRSGGPVVEPRAETISRDSLGVEWEWEDSPEMTIAVVDDVDEAVRLFNEQSPRLIASLISDDPDEHQRFFDIVDAPFVGNGFTRWVDGQYALGKPELGLSNWQFGRLFARGGILSGDSVYTIRTRVTQERFDIGR